MEEVTGRRGTLMLQVLLRVMHIYHMYVCVCVCVCVCSVSQSCLTFCDPMDCSSLVSSVHVILQERILEWVTISFSRGIFPTQG